MLDHLKTSIFQFFSCTATISEDDTQVKPNRFSKRLTQMTLRKSEKIDLSISVEELNQLVDEWLRLDQNPKTRNEIVELVKNDDLKELENRLKNPITFGTAGLRATMEAGFSRMNELTVIQATQGLLAYLMEISENLEERGVVIGHDHRHNSEMFARLAAGVFLARNIKVYYYKNLVHTPMVPYAVTKLNSCLGIMITASHNPKQDNGYKVYWENGCQIIPPHDKGIADKIALNRVPTVWNSRLVDESSKCLDPYEIMCNSYFEEIGKFSASQSANSDSSLRLVYTPLHGVGLTFATRAFKVFGLPPFITVKEQTHPDPEFSTVKYPNPEEHGALDLAIKTANDVNACLVLANDPDADRFSVAEKQPDGRWLQFTGDQIGVILAVAMLQKFKSLYPVSKIAMLNSAVSSKMLKKIAEVEGFYYEETLTGFKWLGNKAIDLEEQGYHVVFAYEEALGYMVKDVVRDKDGISAMVCFTELAVHIYERKISVYDFLHSIYAKYGYFVSSNSYAICNSQETINRIFDAIRYGSEEEKEAYKDTPIVRMDQNKPSTDKPLHYPLNLGKHPISAIRDLTIGYDSDYEDLKPRLPVSPSSQMITFRIDFNRCVITLRTSGTEPKIKYYIELAGNDIEQSKKDVQEIENIVIDQFLKPSFYQITLPG